MRPIRSQPRAAAHDQSRRAVSVALLAVALAVAGAACDSIAGPAATPVVPLASSTVTPASSPTPSPSPKAHDLAIAAFVEDVTGGSLSYRVKFTGQMAVSVDVLPIAGSMDVSGDDFASSFTYDLDNDYPGSGKTRVQVRGVGGKGYIKRGGAAWASIKGYGVEDSYVPFKAITSIRDVRYMGPANIDGKVLHIVSIPGALLIHPNTIPGESKKEKVDRVTLELLLDDAGRPIVGVWKLRGQSRVGAGIGQLQRVAYDLDLRFSKIGAKLTIKRP
jgi:hypothetical protein